MQVLMTYVAVVESPEVTDSRGGEAPDEIRALGMHGKYRDMITAFTWVLQEV